MSTLHKHRGKPSMNEISFLVVILYVCTFHALANPRLFSSGGLEYENKIRNACLLRADRSSINTTECQMFLKRLTTELDITSSRSYRYTRRLWRAMAKVTQHLEEKEDTSVSSWTVNAYNADVVNNTELIFNGVHDIPLNSSVSASGSITSDLLTRLELVIPYHIIGLHTKCGQIRDRNESFVFFNGEKIARKGGTVPFNNMLVFQLPTVFNASNNSDNIKVTVQTNDCHQIPNLKRALLLQYLNINSTNLENIQSTASGKRRKRAGRNSSKAEVRMRRLGKGRTELEHKTRMRSLNPTGKLSSARPCSLQSYKVNVATHLKMRWIFEPKVINLGVCKGSCNVGDLEATNSHITARSVFLNLLEHPPKNRNLERSSCVPYKMKSVTILAMTTFLTLKNYPGVMIDSCRCV